MLVSVAFFVIPSEIPSRRVIECKYKLYTHTNIRVLLYYKTSPVAQMPNSIVCPINDHDGTHLIISMYLSSFCNDDDDDIGYGIHNKDRQERQRRP